MKSGVTKSQTSLPVSDKLSIKNTMLIGLGFMSCMLVWGMYNFYFPRILAGHYINNVPYRVGYFTGDLRLFLANLVMTFDNIAAIFFQPYFGELSDRLKSKFGRRTPFLIIGIPIAAICMFILPFLSVLPNIFLLFFTFITIVIIFNLAMAFYRAPVVALMPDMTKSVHRSMANVIINIMGGIGTAIGYLMGPLIGKWEFVNEKTIGYTTFQAQNFIVMDMMIFYSTAILLLIILGLFLLFVHEVPTGTKFWEVSKQRIRFDAETLQILPPLENDSKKTEEHYNTFREIRAIFKVKEKSAAFMFLTIFFWSASEDAFGTNMSLWGAEYAWIPDTFLAWLSIISGIFVAILGYPGAKLSNQKGRIWTMRIGLLALAISYAGIIIFQEFVRAELFWLGFVGILFCLGIKAAGGALLGIAAITIIWQLAPKDKTGTYTGLYYVFKQTGSVLSPLIIGGILSLFTPYLGTTDVWVVLNPFCLILAIIGYMMMRHVFRGEIGDELSPDQIEELERVYRSDTD